MRNEKKRSPAIRFPEFSEDWEVRRLRDLVTRVIRKNITSCTNVLTVSAQLGLISQVEFFNKSVAGQDVSGYYLLQRDDFAYNKSYSRGYPMGAVKRLRRYSEGIVSTLYICFSANSDVSTDYLEQFFEAGRHNRELSKIAQEGARNHGLLNIAVNDFFDIDILIPRRSEQDRIAAFLSAVDEKMAQLSKIKELLLKYKKGVMQQIFDQEIRFTKDDGNDFPEWEEKKLGDIATFLKGSGISKEDTASNGLYECIRYGELYTHYGETIDKVVSRTSLGKAELIFSKGNDVIIPSSGETNIDIARAASVLRKGIALGGDLTIIRSNLNGVFLSYYLNSKKKYDIARIAQGVSVVHLYPSHLASLKLEIPSIDEQKMIADFLSSIDKKVGLVNREIEGIRAFKKGLLQQMFV